MKRGSSNKTQNTPVSIRLQPKLNDQLAALAASFDRPKSWVIEQAIRDYLAVQMWQLAAIEEGIAAADAGRVVAHEAVAAWVESWDQAEECAVPECG
ncbi:MAG: CopG family ribbon-helix-helix protein [Alphaproteobacteria bacterium]